MNGSNKKMELLGSAPVSKALLAMGLPTMIGMMINALYNLVDAYFVGGLGTSQMGAISVAFPLGQVIVGLGLLFGNGAASYISRLLGRGGQGCKHRPVQQPVCWGGNDTLFPVFSEADTEASGCHGKHPALCGNLYCNLCNLINFQHIQCHHEQYCHK